MIGLEEALTTGGRRLEVAWPARRWTPELRHEYAAALRAIGDPTAIIDGINRAVTGWGGDFPPSVASLCELVWDAQRKRLEGERDKQTEAQREAPHGLRDEQVAPVWHGYLHLASVIVNARRRGQATRSAPHIEPYIALVERTGWTSAMSCNEFYDEGGRLHPADQAYAGELTRQVMREAAEIFAESGLPDTPGARVAAVRAFTGIGARSVEGR